MVCTFKPSLATASHANATIQWDTSGTSLMKRVERKKKKNADEPEDYAYLKKKKKKIDENYRNHCQKLKPNPK